MSAAVEVLLATYNGERFVREQIDSIAAQDYPEVRILARDDGSTDGTAAILDEYARAYPGQFRVLPAGEPTGSAKGNFAKLMQAATGSYVAFADQDDVWLPEKLSLTMEKMRRLEQATERETPLLVFSDLRVVDEALQPLHDSLWKHLRLEPGNIQRPARMLGQSVVTGATMLVNRRMLELGRQMPLEAVMHDRWIGLLAAFLGAADFVSSPTVLYRQHGSNSVGAAGPNRSVAGLLARVRSGEGRGMERRRSEEQAEALLGLYREQLTPERKSLLKRYLRSGRSSDPLTRIWLTLRYGFYRGSLAADVALVMDLALRNSQR